MPSLDTNCLLHWFLDDIPAQRRAVEHLLATQSQHVDDVALIEAVYALETSAKLSRQTIGDFLLAAMAEPIDMDRALWTEIMSLWIGHPKLSVVDVYLSVRAGRLGHDPVYTFDAKMANQLEGVELVPSV